MITCQQVLILMQGEPGATHSGEAWWGMRAFLWQFRLSRLLTVSPRTVGGLAAAAMLSLSLAACSSADTSTAPSLTSGSGGVGGPAATGTVTTAPTATSAPTSTPRPVVAATTRATTAPAPPTQAPPQAANMCGAPANPWGYNFCGGNVIPNPPASFCSYFSCIASFWKSTNGYVEQCVDGMFSHSGGRSGSCSYHGGNSRPLYGA